MLTVRHFIPPNGIDNMLHKCVRMLKTLFVVLFLMHNATKLATLLPALPKSSFHVIKSQVRCEGVALNDAPIENYHPNVQFQHGLWGCGVLVSFSLLSWFQCTALFSAFLFIYFAAVCFPQVGFVYSIVIDIHV